MVSHDLPLQTRTALRADEPAIRHLLAHALRPSVRSWWWEEHLGQEVFLVSLSAGRLAGALLACPDVGPVAWVRLGALASGVGVGPWLDSTLPRLTAPLRRLGARLLAWMDVGEWAGPGLRMRGFRQMTRLVTMAKDDRWLPNSDATGVCLRPAQPGDIPILAWIDHAAFSPPWWLSAGTLGRLQAQSLCFLVAEQGGRCLGYVEARPFEHGAHIGRLTVEPRVQRQGVGSLLLAGALSYLWGMGVERVTLNTQEENFASQRLYRRFGFRPFGPYVAVWGRWL